jgi:hypothetical protein
MKLPQAETASTATQALWKIAETDNADHVEALLATGVDINASNAHGMTALMRAASNGRIRMVHSLLDHGADPNKSRHDGFTPLQLAAFFGHEEVVRILVEHGAKIDAATRFGTSAQMWASARTFHDVVHALKNSRSGRRLEKKPITTQNIQREISHSKVNAVIVAENKVDGTGSDQLKSGAETRKIQIPWEPSVSQAELRELVLAELARQFHPSNRTVRLYASAGVLAIVVVLASVMFRKQQHKEVTLPIIPAATANGAKVSFEKSSADAIKKSDPPAVKLAAIPENNNSNVQNSFKRSERERSNVPTRSFTADEKQTSAKLKSMDPPVAKQNSIELQPRDLPPAPIPVAKSKAVPPRDEPKRPAPLTTQLITPSNNSTLKGKVIQWP